MEKREQKKSPTGFTVMDRVGQLIIKGVALIIYFKTKCVHFPLFEN